MTNTDGDGGKKAGQAALLEEGGKLDGVRKDGNKILPIKVEHVWKVTLRCPSRAPAALRAFIIGTPKVPGAKESAQEIIQKMVDQLGRGTPVPPPASKSPLVTQGGPYKVGEGAINPAYQETVSVVRSRQDSLHEMDNQVASTSVVVADKKHDTLAKIKKIVSDLNSALRPFDGRKLSKADVMEVYRIVALAVMAVCNEMATAVNENAQLAQDPGGNGTKPGIPAAETVDGTGAGMGTGTKAGTEPGPGSGTGTGTQAGTGTGPGAGSGSGGIGDILGPLLTAVPMMAMPLMSIIPELLKKEEEEPAPADEAGAPTPTDPTALVPVAAETTVTAADNGQPVSLPSLAGLGRSAVSRRDTRQASPGNDASPTEDGQDVAEPVLEQE